MQNEDTTKYIIRTKITADGVIERPDIVGAIFGQTEGLLGTDLDLRELQKTGRIGRIEVMVTTKNGKTRGNIFIPSSLDKVKTSVLAASLETIDRVGPCVANIEVTKIEDVRASKRVDIVERAKDIYKTMFEDDLLEAQEITDVIRESVRVEGIAAYGKNKLPAGPEYNSNEIIVVEGRADVLTLLKYGIKNTISVGGTNIPPEVVDLLKGKKVTVFTDGDRGGELIIRELIQVTNVDYIARPPDGKAVEDMVQKEIVLALRRRMTKDQYIEKYGIVLPASKRSRRPAETDRFACPVKTAERGAPKKVSPIRRPAVAVSRIDEEEDIPVRRSRTERLPEKPERRRFSEKIADESAEAEEKPIRQLRARPVKPKATKEE
ncbi:MAG: DNA primase, partial [Methanosarcinales archaeon]|nr:DNA primase [Methanosarcinales archaeon]